MLSENSIKKLLLINEIYRNEYATIREKDDIENIMQILTEIPFFEDILKIKGYFCLKRIIMNMKIKLKYKNEIVYKSNEKERKCYILLYGEIEKINNKENVSETTRSFFGGISYQCMKNSYFLLVDTSFYISQILMDVEVFKKEFLSKIRQFKLFSNLIVHHYDLLFLNYDEQIFDKNEVIYKQNDVVNGLYLIKEGEFQIFKKEKKKSINDEILLINEELEDLQKKGKILEKLASDDGRMFKYNKKDIDYNNKKEIKTKIRFSQNKNASNVIKLKTGEMFGDLEITHKYLKRKYTVLSSALYNKVWYFPKKIIEEIFHNDDSLSQVSSIKLSLLKKQFNKIKLMQNIREKYNIHNEMNGFRKSSVDSNNTKKNSFEINNELNNSVNKIKNRKNANFVKIRAFSSIYRPIGNIANKTCQYIPPSFPKIKASFKYRMKSSLINLKHSNTMMLTLDKNFTNPQFKSSIKNKKNYSFYKKSNFVNQEINDNENNKTHYSNKKKIINEINSINKKYVESSSYKNIYKELIGNRRHVYCLNNTNHKSFKSINKNKESKDVSNQLI